MTDQELVHPVQVPRVLGYLNQTSFDHKSPSVIGQANCALLQSSPFSNLHASRTISLMPRFALQPSSLIALLASA